MTKSTSLTRKVRHRRNAITPTAIAKLHALELIPYRQNLPSAVSRYTWSATHPNTIMENSCSAYEQVCVTACVCVRERERLSTVYMESFPGQEFRQAMQLPLHCTKINFENYFHQCAICSIDKQQKISGIKINFH